MSVAPLVPPRRRADWWLRNGRTTLFMLRELSAVAIAGFLGELLALLNALAFHPGRYDDLVAALSRPGPVAFNLVALAFAVLHSVTFFRSAADALPVAVGGRPVLVRTVAGWLIGGWLVLSAVLGWVLVAL